jgi:hypothetical protein
VSVRDHLDRYRREYGQPIRLGCSTIAHDRLGYCAVCVRDREGPDVAASAELAGWRLLAMAEQEESR